jgi:bifunctional DNase/RNase
MARQALDARAIMQRRAGEVPYTMLEMVIYGVSFDMVGKQPIVLLKTVSGNLFLPIWIGHPEAAAILMRLQGATPPRPSTHDLFTQAMGELGGEVSKVSITELRDATFFAEITVTSGKKEVTLDSRPSDALALAVRVDAPIFADEGVVEESGIKFEQDTMEDKETMVEDFKSFLEDVKPEDFGKLDN